MRVIPGFREIVSILYSRGGDDVKLDGEFILVKGHAGIDVVITAAVEPALATQLPEISNPLLLVWDTDT